MYPKPPVSYAATPAPRLPHVSQSSRSVRTSAPHFAASPPAETQSSSSHSSRSPHSELTCAPDAPTPPHSPLLEPFAHALPAPPQPQHAPVSAVQTPRASPSPPPPH